MREKKTVNSDPHTKIRLTIAIPTFNRNEILKANVAKLVPQLTSDCELLILDNCSTEPVENTLKDTLTNIKNVRTQIIRNRANVGANENILRCIEQAQGEYVWILGDDDAPISSAITHIFQELDEHPDALVFNMYAPCPMHAVRSKTKKVFGSTGYLSAAAFLGELIFISSIIVKVAPSLRYMSSAHLWQSSHAPHLIIAAMILRPNGMAIISSREVVLNGGITTPTELQSSVIPIALGFPTLMLAPWNKAEAKYVISLLKSVQQKGWVTPKGVLNQLVYLANRENDQEKEQALRYYYLLQHNFFALGCPISLGRILFIGALPLIVWPKMGKLVRDIAWRMVKRRQYDSSVEQDLYRG